MRGLLLLILAGAVAFGAEDEWAKVKALKTGAEFASSKGLGQPVLAQMDELTDDNLIVIVKRRRPPFQRTRSTASMRGPPAAAA